MLLLNVQRSVCGPAMAIPITLLELIKLPIHYQVQNLLEEEYGVDHEEAALIVQNFLVSFRKNGESPSLTLDDWRRYLWREALGQKYQNLAGDIYDQWAEWRWECLQPDEGVRSMLQMLKQHYMLGLITNGFSRSQWEKVHQLHLQPHFHSILVSGDLCWEKPSKAIFTAACDQLGVAPEECIMIGDRLETDIAGARNAELAAAVWVPVEETRCDVDVAPDAVIKHVSMLPRLLPPPRPDLGRFLNLSEPESENSNSSEMS